MSNFLNRIINKVSKGGDSIFKNRRTGEAREHIADEDLDASVLWAARGHITSAVHSLGWLREEKGICIVAVIDKPLDEHDADLLSQLQSEVIAIVPEYVEVAWVVVPLVSLGDPWDKVRFLYRRGDPMTPPYDFREEAPVQEFRWLKDSEISNALKKAGRKHVRKAVQSIGWVRSPNGIVVGVMIARPMAEDDVYALYSLEKAVVAKLGESIRVHFEIVPLPTEEQTWKNCQLVLRRNVLW